MNVSTSSTATNAAYSSNGLSGLISGMDTEALVKSQLANIQNKIDKQNQEKQKLEWKQEIYRDVITKINNFNAKYFDITSSSSLVTTGVFNKMKAESSTSAISVTTATAAANMNIQVAQLASKTSLVSAKASSGEINIAFDSSYFSSTAQTIELTAGDKSLEINMSEASSIEDVVNQINSSDLGITASLEDGKISLVTDDTSEFALSGSASALSALGLSAGQAAQDSETGFYTMASDTEADLTKLTDETKTSAELTFSLDGITKKITLTAGMTADEANAELESQLKKAFGSNVTLENGVITTGEGQRVSISGDVEVLGLNGTASTGITLSTKLSEANIGGLTADENGNYTLTINNEEFSFDGNSTISDVMSKINSSDIGVKMTYNSLSDRFSLTSETTGAGFEITVGGNIGDAIFGGGSDYTAGRNAVLNVDGVRIEKMTNTFTYNGVSMNLKSTTGNYLVGGDGKVQMGSNGAFLNADGTESSFETVNSERDVDSIVTLLSDFANDYNKLIEELNGYTHADAEYKEYPPLTDEQKAEMTESQIAKWEEKAKTGLLRNDSNISSFLTTMRSAFYTNKGTDVVASQIGIDSSSEWKDYGKLVIDEDVLKNAVTNNIDSVINLFTDTEAGLANTLKNACKVTANTSSASPGTLVREAGIAGKASESNNYIQSRIEQIESRLESLQITYDNRKTRYWNQYNAMENMINNMSSQSAWLAQMIGG